MRRGIFYLSRAERLALGCLCVVLTGIGIYRSMPAGGPEVVRLDDSVRMEVHRFMREVKTGVQRTDRLADLRPFDPNRVDSATLASYGLPPAVAGRVVRYRQAGGRFRCEADLARIYGMRDTDYERLRPYLRFGPQKAERRYSMRKSFPDKQKGTLAKRRKLASGEFVELNAADSAALCRVPGIGPVRARAIIRYGNRLGGYVSVNQLGEVYGIPDSSLCWFKVEPVVRTPLYLNRASFKELLRHPYLSYEQVQTIIRHRQKFGPLDRLEQLSLYEVFTERDLARLAPYVHF